MRVLRPATPAIDDLARSPHEAEVSVPRPRPGMVGRAGIIAAARASACRVVCVTAPAGYGKTTLLAQWAQVEDRPVAWASLGRYDDDPAILLTVLAAAFARISPGHSALVAAAGGVDVDAPGLAAASLAGPHLTAPVVPAPVVPAPGLAAAFAASPEPFVLMLDDLHELRSPACHDVLRVAMAGIPPGSQLVAASRGDQPHLPRLRASGDAVEIRRDDLALDSSGARQVFAEADVRISDELATEVTERTEGWPVGLHLTAEIARHEGTLRAAVSGDDRYVADYLYRESLMLLPERTRCFLRRTAVLDRLCAPLVDAVLDGSGGQEHLQGLEASNSFLIPLDRHREWFRHHVMYREFLLGELRRVEPEVIPELHRRAADWHENSGSTAPAIEHLLNTPERDRCVRLVAGSVRPTYMAGRVSTVRRWLSALGDPVVEDHPPLAVLAGWIAASTGQVLPAQRWAAVVDAASFEGEMPDGAASFDSARAMLRAAMCASGPQQMMADARVAVAQEPPWSSWRDTALVLAAHAYLLAGDHDAAGELFSETITVAARLGNTETIVDAASELAVLAMDRGRFTEAAEHVGRALETVDRHRLHDYPAGAPAFATAARLAVHRGDLAEADAHLARAMRARASCTVALPFLAVSSRLQLATLFSTRGDRGAARRLMREIDEVLRSHPALGALVDRVATVRDAASRSAQVAASGMAPLTGAELRVLPYLQTHLTIREIGARLFVSRNTVSSEVASIYRKLGASSRNEAVEQATRIGLLGA